MSTAHIDSERIAEPSGAAWSDAEAAHLAACGECRLEVELIAATRHLGRSQLAGLDLARVASDVRLRLEAVPVVPRPLQRRPVRWLSGFAAAAAIIVAVYAGLPKHRPAPQLIVQEPPAVSMLHELDGLSEPELEEVLQSIPPASEMLDHVEIAPLSDLDAHDLERMLRSMEE